MNRSPKIFRPEPDIRDQLLGLVAEKKDPDTRDDCPRVALFEGIESRARAVINLPLGVEVRIIFNGASIPMEPRHADVCRYEFVGSRKPTTDLGRTDLRAGGAL